MIIKTIKEAKKYIGKTVYTASDCNKRDIFEVVPLYIGGVNLYFNQVDYEVEGFHLCENKKCSESYGDVKLEDIADEFDNTAYSPRYYFFSKKAADEYCEWFQKDSDERNKGYDIKTAKELLKKHSVKYEIFD